MTTNKQRREAERRRLQRQLEQRRQREIARRRFTLISSVVGTLAVIVVIVVVIIAVSGGDDSKPKKTPAAAAPPSSSSAAPAAPATPCATNKGATASLKGVTVAYANNLKHEPKIRSTSTTNPATVECQDLVVGTGKAAATQSSVSVQYTGVLYKNGKQFDSSWARGGKAVPFSLAKVVPGFTQGIGGAGKVAPMKVGGRRIIIMPASLAYGAQGNQGVPPNSPLVFVVDLKSVTG